MNLGAAIGSYTVALLGDPPWHVAVAALIIVALLIVALGTEQGR